ncbi:hypothetical protein QCE63_16400 [Caballeronia sp. LZ065]|uniref:hypothetical protein n=1 Tax=Caballeronia sp. LZ065 TaxID=3038571 RepID=UPI0028551D4D|nr:hypothetical protein [Caballeronia sp. LZ065]MDR5781004.1 hypothetical protein [Caballeronia sp. LZ065]
MLGDFLETIGSLGVLASAMVHYRIAVSGRGEALAGEAGARVGDPDAGRVGAGTSPNRHCRERASDG